MASKYNNQTEADAALDGKYNTMTASASTMSVNSATFTRETIVSVSSALEITSVSSLDFEVVFDVAANVTFTYPDSLDVIGDDDATTRRLYSFLRGNLVIGNFN